MYDSEHELPAGKIHGSLYVPNADAVVVSLSPKGTSTPVRKLYWRRSTSTAYHLVQADIDGDPNAISYEFPVAGEAPRLFFLAIEIVATEQGFAGRDSHIGFVDLAKNGAVTVLDMSRHSALIVARLLGASPDGSAVYGSFGFPGTDGGPITYHLCRLDVDGSKLTTMAELPRVSC